jgi:CTP synthase (UTP-ammonia lyase)
MDGMGRSLHIAVVGDFHPEYESHQAINRALAHSATAMGVEMNSQWVATGCVEHEAEKILRSYDGFYISSGSPYRSMEGAFAAIRFARIHGWPLIGT